MLNLKNHENNAVFDEICKKKKKGKIKTKFQKMKDAFLDSIIPWLKSHQPPLVYIFNKHSGF